MIHLKEIEEKHDYVGGKAFVLGKMLQRGMNVPEGYVLSNLPSEKEKKELLNWWQQRKQPQLAIRSSAYGEDSAELSHAGQQKTFLNVNAENDIFASISKCFSSTQQTSSIAYRSHFGEEKHIPMNVVIQEMIDPQFSGVFFSVDPRTDEMSSRASSEHSYLIEIIEGLGERLVSGQVNPYRVDASSAHTPKNWKGEWTQEIVEAGLEAEDLLSERVDMEWCIDRQGVFWALQARPITATGSHQKKLIEEEIDRLKKLDENSIWDGQTFSDWTSTVSELTFEVWQEAFSTKGSFCNAMKYLGYLGDGLHEAESVLDRVFGRAYINLSRLEPLFFGDIPYTIESTPRPHLKFDPRKITAKMILKTPGPLSRMIRVGWRLRTCRLKEIENAKKGLDHLKSINSNHVFLEKYDQSSTSQLFEVWCKEKEKFARETMTWSFILTFMIESTLQTLKVMLEKVEGHNAQLELQEWLSVGVHTKNREMSDAVRNFSSGLMDEGEFLLKFGHRGPGEMDLSHPRWFEAPPQKSKNAVRSHRGQRPSVEDRVSQYGKMRGSVILQEWQILKQLLELREEWKNEILRPYARLRAVATELGKQMGVDELIFWLNSHEIKKFIAGGPVVEAMEIAKRRKALVSGLNNVNLPKVFSLSKLEQVIKGEQRLSDQVLAGESLSVGVAHGTALFVERPEQIKIEDLPDDFILLARTIDPGWTHIFCHARAILTENGGVLSHAAIVAREMGIPAVSQLSHLHKNIKNGSKIWVDGTHGRVTLGEKNANRHH